MSKNPLLNQKYNEGYEDGEKAGVRKAKHSAAAAFTVKLERIAAIKGVGPKMFEKIILEFQKELSPEEKEKVDIYMQEFRDTKSINVAVSK